MAVVYPSDHPVLIRVQPALDEKPPLVATGEAAAAAEPRQDDVVYYALRPVWFAMQAVGFYPMHRHCRGGKPKEPSPWLGLNVLQYAGAVALMAAAYAFRGDDAAQDFDGTIIKYLVNIQCALPILLLPLFALQRRGQAEYLHEWNALQVEFARQAGRPLSAQRRFSSRDAMEMLTIVVLWEVVLACAQLPLHPPVVVAALLLSNAVSALLTSAWYLHGRLLRYAARATADHLAQLLARPAPTPAQVDTCRLQMLRLVTLSTGLGAAMTLCLGFLLLLHFVLLTLSLYGLFGQLSHSQSSVARLPGLLAGVVFSGTVLYVVCDTGHRVARAVKTQAVQEMLTFRRRTPVVGEDLQAMIETFIATAQEVPSDVTLSGITILNRQLFTAVLSTMVTYLVVVVQFRVSLEAKDDTMETKTTTMATTGSSLMMMSTDSSEAAAHSTAGLINAVMTALATSTAASLERNVTEIMP